MLRGERCAETLFFDYHRQHAVDIRLVRIFNTYGPRMHPNDGRVVSNFIVSALCGNPITLYRDGSQTRSLCYVDDMVDGLIRMMRQDRSIGPVNLGNSEEVTIRDLAERVIRMTGQRAGSSLDRFPMTIPNAASPTYSEPPSCFNSNPVWRWIMV